MVRLNKMKIFISKEVEVVIKDRVISAKGHFGSAVYYLHDVLCCKRIEDNLVLSFRKEKRFINNKSLLGTTYSLLRSLLIGVSVGFVKKLQLVGVGYRAVLEENIIILNVGFSHTVSYKLPSGVSALCPSSIDIILNSVDKQLIGQVAADLRAIRPPEPFSGKGIRYVDEILRIKEVKKK